MTESQPGPSQECVEIPSRSQETSSTPNKVEGHGDSVLVPCSIPGCGEEVFNMKKHIEQDHALAVFDYYQHPSLELTRSRVQCLVQMVQAIFGESAILQDMVDYVNNRRSIAPG